MISKGKIRELSDYKKKKRCDEESVFVAEGVKICDEALAAKLPVRVVCATVSWFSQHPQLPPEAELFEVGDEALERLSCLKTPNEVWMLIGRDHPLPEGLPRSPLTLALDRLQDPGNMGTVIRTADWFGIRRIVCSPDTVSCYNPKVVQATMGSLFRTEIIYTDLPQWLSQCGQPVYGALLDGDSVWKMEPLNDGMEAVLVIGNESQGLSPEVQACLTRRVAIPNPGGTAESLNAGVACAILTDELLRHPLANHND